MPSPRRAGVRPPAFDSLGTCTSNFSTAPLPPRYAVTLGHLRAPTEEEIHAAATAGAEAVSDAAAPVRIVPLPPRRSLCESAPWAEKAEKAERSSRKRKGKERDTGQSEESSHVGVFWRTAGTLASWPKGKTPPYPPPTTSELPPLESQEPHLVPLIGDALLPWAADDDGDLDPAMDNLAEFEYEITPLWRDHSWQFEPPPNLKQADKGKNRALDLSPIPLPPPLLPSLVPPSSSPPLPPSSFPKEPPQAVLPSSYIVPATPDAPPVDPNTSWRSRRQWWRGQTDASGYGEFWAHLPRHTYPSLVLEKQARLKRHKMLEFQLPRNLSEIEHPFHPDIHYYASHARTRVHWTIPVNGPVVVPGSRDPVTTRGAAPWASRAAFAADPTTSEEAFAALLARKAKSAALPRPEAIHWTPSLLRAFVHHFHLGWEDRARPYGALHLTCSGPKPDPFSDNEPPPPLERHDCVPPTANAYPPRRVEAGDHIRIYCDARRAMAVRLWLHWWVVQPEVLARFHGWTPGTGLGACEDPNGEMAGVKAESSRGGSSPTAGGDTDKKLLPLERARLALVGPRGEILMVA